jgi:uncharacterized phage-associated protein
MLAFSKVFFIIFGVVVTGKLKHTFNSEKTIAAMKLVLSNMDTKSCDFHKLFKILYFAEQKHLVNYGRTIIGDRYVAMKDGPVPSNVYDVLKIVRGDSIFNSSIDFSQYFEVKNGQYVYLKDDNVNMDLFSQSELNCLVESINENKDLSFAILRDKSHDDAWHNANRNDDMSIFDIAKAAGANDELLKYMAVTSENRKVELK